MPRGGIGSARFGDKGTRLALQHSRREAGRLRSRAARQSAGHQPATGPALQPDRRRPDGQTGGRRPAPPRLRPCRGQGPVRARSRSAAAPAPRSAGRRLAPRPGGNLGAWEDNRADPGADTGDGSPWCPRAGEHDRGFEPARQGVSKRLAGPGLSAGPAGWLRRRARPPPRRVPPPGSASRRGGAARRCARPLPSSRWQGSPAPCPPSARAPCS